jgi:hypothetical protein
MVELFGGVWGKLGLGRLQWLALMLPSHWSLTQDMLQSPRPIGTPSSLESSSRQQLSLQVKLLGTGLRTAQGTGRLHRTSKY